MFKRILLDACRLVFGNLNIVFRICALWLVVLVFCRSLFLAWTPSLPALPVFGPGGYSYWSPILRAFELFLPTAITSAYELVAAASIGVALHRYGLLGEVPDRLHFRIRKREIYVSRQLLLLSAVSIAVSFLRILAIFTIKDIELVLMFGDLFSLAVTILIAPMLARAALAMPATAIDRPIGLRAAFSYGRGLGLPMLGAGLVLLAPLNLADYGLFWLVPLLPEAPAEIALTFKVALLGPVFFAIKYILIFAVVTAGYRLAAERFMSERHRLEAEEKTSA